MKANKQRSLIALLALITTLLLAAPASACHPACPLTKKTSTASTTKTAPTIIKPSVYRTSLVSSSTGNAGWRVSHGKVNIGWRPGARSIIDEKPMLAGLSGLVKPKISITLAEKATIKHEKIPTQAKYQSLVDALKGADNQRYRRGR